MKILFLSSFISRFDGSNALVRLIDGLRARGHECIALSYPGGQQVNDPGYLALSLSENEQEQDRRYSQHEGAFLPWMHRLSGSALIQTIKSLKPDIINLHWTHGPNFIPLDCLPALTKIAPVFWTLHDMWPFTGNCFYSNGCRGFEAGCAACAGILSDVDAAYPQQARYLRKSQALWEAKKGIYEQLKKIQFIAPSLWMKTLLQRSALLGDRPVHLIPYGVPTDIFCPRGGDAVRKDLHLSPKRFVILLASVTLNDPRKGCDLFIKALSLLPEPDIAVIALGQASEELRKQIPFPCKTPGLVKTNQEMATFYNAADLYVLPTRADNLPSTILESMSCGLPVVSFKVGGIPEMVVNGNGYLAQAGSAKDLAAGIRHIYQMPPEARRALGHKNRLQVIKRYSISKQAQAYEQLFTHAT